MFFLQKGKFLFEVTLICMYWDAKFWTQSSDLIGLSCTCATLRYFDPQFHKLYCAKVDLIYVVKQHISQEKWANENKRKLESVHSGMGIILASINIDITIEYAQSASYCPLKSVGWSFSFFFTNEGKSGRVV